MKYFFKSLIYKIKYNRIFTHLAIKTNERIRKRQRNSWMSNETDPYFVMRSDLFQRGIQSELTDKLKVKEFVLKNNYAKVPKTLFTFNRKGILISGSTPKTGKVVIKSSNGSGYVRVADVSEITTSFLGDVYKKFYFKSKYYGMFEDEMMYSKNEPILYAEDFLGDNIIDYKIHISKNGHMFLGCFDRKNELVVSHYLNGVSFGGYDNHSDEGSHLSEKNCRIFKSLLPIAEEIQKKLGRYVRVDFYIAKGDVYIGELTFMSGAGKIFEGIESPTPGYKEFMKIIEWYS